ncbi:hypothetical protein NC653_005957 [Populus alba x Populus x berolinensis]|uniref:Uncharacterized protein n=1 Tax=Populus alba x Populus x berolinensis TaxID=444605 RepID=A0AAD6WCH5_9ROSI|nr:hypothetical protein NC653_005957 [Populus alba x Populus x berolinensis]
MILIWPDLGMLPNLIKIGWLSFHVQTLYLVGDNVANNDGLVRQPHTEAVKRAVSDHHALEGNNFRLTVTMSQLRISGLLQAIAGGHLFNTSIYNPYLSIFRIAMSMEGSWVACCCVILAAAVSDFYVLGRAEHKILSASGPLEMRLVQCPENAISTEERLGSHGLLAISFKLETDSKILLLINRKY